MEIFFFCKYTKFGYYIDVQISSQECEIFKMTEVVRWNLKKKHTFELLNFNISVHFRHRNFLNEYFKGT